MAWDCEFAPLMTSISDNILQKGDIIYLLRGKKPSWIPTVSW